MLPKEFELHYYNSDDGIWIGHKKCIWMKNLDYSPTAQDVLDAVEEHRCADPAA